jgi:hypothetical protein
MPGGALTNEELMARLKAHNYPVPPITASTRGVLLRKLEQLDAEKKRSARGKGQFFFGKYSGSGFLVFL